MKTLFLMVLISMSQTVLAHPGHDHSHFLSDALHLLLISGSVAVFIVGCIRIRNDSLAKEEKKNKRW